MGRKIHSLMMAGGLAVAGVALFAGCSTGDRSTGQYIDDRQTASKVKSELKHNPIYKFEDVNVNTYRGVVQLSGWVEKPEQKQIAGNLAKNVPGVLDVVNNIAIKPKVQLVTPSTESSTGRPSSEPTVREGQGSRESQQQNQP
jgi:hyperosmotically inducible periplasmic protein